MNRTLLVLVILSIVFWLKSELSLDPDFGWHIAAGRYLLENGIPTTDPFSFSMPSYPFVDYEWLTHILLALTYPFIGNFGLAVVFALLTCFALRLQVKHVPFANSAVPLLMTSSILLLFVGIRPQVLSWFFFSCMLWLLSDQDRWRKLRFFLPPLFLLWANLHGSFPAGLLLLGIVLGVRAFYRRHLHKTDGFIFLLCLAATFVNPYGSRLWHEIWLIGSESSLRWTIPEWMPLVLYPSGIVWGYIALACLAVWRYRHIFTPEQLTLFGAFLLASILSIRHLPFWLLISLPMISASLSQLRKDVRQYPHGEKRFAFAYRVLLILTFGVVLFQSVSTLTQAWKFSETKYYPEKAVRFLQNERAGNIFTHYRWGGYVLWKLSGVNVFMDGRMVHWRYTSPHENESIYPFQDYRDVLNGKKAFTDIRRKYKIDTVLLARQRYENGDIGQRPLDTWERMLAEQRNEKRYPSLSVQLERDGWRVVYQDDVALIYQHGDSKQP